MTIIGDYRLIQTLGEGGMGRVYLAEHLPTKQTIALKWMHQRFADDTAIRARFDREIRVMRELRGHPNILPLLETGEAEGVPYFTMPYIAGGSVYQRLKQNTSFSQQECAEILDDLTSALEFAHARNILHRDIKPGNILLATNGEAYLTDFGIATDPDPNSEFHTLTIQGSSLGTMGYIAPEVIQGIPATRSSDVYALGVTIYEMLTGRKFARALAEMPNPWEGIPPSLGKVLHTATQQAPLKRYPTIADFNRAFRAGLGQFSPPLTIIQPMPIYTPPQPATPPYATPISRTPPYPTPTPAPLYPIPPQKRKKGIKVSYWGLIALGAMLFFTAFAILIGSSQVGDTIIANQTATAQTFRDNLTRTAEFVYTSRTATAIHQANLRLTSQAILTQNAQRVLNLGMTQTAVADITQTALAPQVYDLPIIETIDGVEMVFVPAGCFTMGSTATQIQSAYNACVNYFGSCDRIVFEAEAPEQTVCFEKPFWIDHTEVTNLQFELWHGTARTASTFTQDYEPRVNITYYEAQEFCHLRGGRLPTEAEWEYAARGPESLLYPWGNTFDTQKARNINSVTTSNMRVGIYDNASWVGALDMAGNVWEWTASPIIPYPYDLSPNIDWGDVDRVLRGGSYVDYANNLRSAFRGWGAPSVKDETKGFRCVRDV